MEAVSFSTIFIAEIDLGLKLQFIGKGRVLGVGRY